MYMPDFWFWKVTWSPKAAAGSGLAAPDLMASAHIVMALMPAALLTADFVGFRGPSYSWPPYLYSMLKNVSIEGPSTPVTPLLESASLAAVAKNSSQVAGGLAIPLAANMSWLEAGRVG